MKTLLTLAILSVPTKTLMFETLNDPMKTLIIPVILTAMCLGVQIVAIWLAITRAWPKERVERSEE